MSGLDGDNSKILETRTYAEVLGTKIETQQNGTWVRCGYVSRVLCTRWEIHPRGKLRKFKNKMLVPGVVDVGGYLIIKPKVGPILESGCRRSRTVSLHRMSLETFYPQPHPSLECDHRDAIRTNYDIFNLRWVSRCLNVTFQNHRGWQRAWRPTLKKWRYRVRFRDKNYPWKYDTQEQARDEYLYIRAVWIRQERERIIKLVMSHNNVSRLSAIRMLNWDHRDDVFFLCELNE